jgi:hypothetical protein
MVARNVLGSNSRLFLGAVATLISEVDESLAKGVKTLRTRLRKIPGGRLSKIDHFAQVSTHNPTSHFTILRTKVEEPAT